MHYTPYRPNSHSWIGGFITFIIGIMITILIVSTIPATSAQTNPSKSRIEILEDAVKELQEKNAELEDRLNLMSDALATNIELVDRIEARIGK